MENSMPSNTGQLYHTIIADDFFRLSDVDILRQIHNDFPDELERLKRAYFIRDPDAVLPKSQSPSQLLYGKDYDEVNRTLVGIFALRWIHDSEYEVFVSTQSDSVKLKRESFEWMRDLFIKGINEPADLHALIMSMIINDLGKDPQLPLDFQKISGEEISGVNHDMILLKAVNIGLVPCLSRLGARHKADIIRGIELGADFNFGQLAQAENVPACLSGLTSMKGQSNAFTSRFMEQLLDIASASGHMDWTCAKKMIEPIYQAYHNVYDVATGIISTLSMITSLIARTFGGRSRISAFLSVKSLAHFTSLLRVWGRRSHFPRLSSSSAVKLSHA